jgi:hypothetical protein
MSKPTQEAQVKSKSELQPVTQQRYGNKRWKRFASHGFAARDSVAPLVAHELQRAVLDLPTAFVKHDKGYGLVAVQGLAQGHNLLVAPDGRWTGGYVPAFYRGHPFKLVKTADGRQALCVDESSGLVTEGSKEGEPFFSDDGKLSKPLAEVLNFLTQVQSSREKTARICAVLDKHKLIHPWHIKIKTESGEQMMKGLFRIDEAALNALPAEALLELRQAWALPVAYCQMLSMQHLPKLAQLARSHAKQGPALPTTASGDLDLEFLNKGETISFGKLD